MKSYTAIVEKCKDTNLYVGYIPGFSGSSSQAESIDELRDNLKEVIEMLLEDGEPSMLNLLGHKKEMKNVKGKISSSRRIKFKLI